MKRIILTMLLLAIPALAYQNHQIIQGKTGQLFAITAEPRKDGKPVAYTSNTAVWTSTNQSAAKVEGYKTLDTDGLPVDGTELQALVTLQSTPGTFTIILTVDDVNGNTLVGVFNDRTVTGTVTVVQMVPTAAVDPP